MYPRSLTNEGYALRSPCATCGMAAASGVQVLDTRCLARSVDFAAAKATLTASGFLSSVI